MKKQTIDSNPNYMFSGIATELLLKAVKKEINIMDLIKKELSERGLGGNGEWIGFKNAKEFWNENEKVWDSHYKKWITIPEDLAGNPIGI